jgi:glucose/arabinose dehydrogenase
MESFAKNKPGTRTIFLSSVFIWVFLIAGCAPQPGPAQPTQLATVFSPPTPQPLNSPTGQATSIVATEKAVPPTSTPSPLPTPAPLFPDPNTATWQPVITGLDSPVGLTNAGDGSGRLFVLEQPGRIRIIKEGRLLPAPFLNITDRVGMNGNEQGLLGLAFHPDYKNNGFFYVNYTDGRARTIIARFKVSADPDVADLSSEKVLFYVNQPFPNHKGGELRFGPDGYLYIGLGDGGSEGDPLLTGQNVNTLLGKILRVDVDSGDPYAIPKDNPFANGGGSPEIWAYGLRNPWRFSFDKATGDLYIADVGQDNYEEIDYVAAGSPGGENFGWSYREGFHPYKGTPPGGLKLVDPVWEYDHSQGCAIIGGAVYRGLNLPAWEGVYFYGDYCSSKVWGLKRGPDGAWQSQLLFETGASITSFGLDETGEIYLVDRKGTIFLLSGK